MKQFKSIIIAALMMLPLNVAFAIGGPAEYHVSTAEEFIHAIGSNRVIYLDYAIFNLSEQITDMSDNGIVERYYDAMDANPSNGPVCAVWANDGIELCITGVKNLTIKSAYLDRSPRVLAEPRYANTISFSHCQGVTIESLVLGHTEGGYCTGGVLYFADCKGITIRHCELFGCGIQGIETRQCENLLFDRSQIRDCTYGIMTLVSSRKCVFRDSQFFRNQEYTLLETRECSDILFEKCDFFDNKGTMFQLGSPVKMNDCHINHPFNKMGNYDMAEGSIIYVEPCGRHNIEYDE